MSAKQGKSEARRLTRAAAEPWAESMRVRMEPSYFCGDVRECIWSQGHRKGKHTSWRTWPASRRQSKRSCRRGISSSVADRKTLRRTSTVKFSSSIQKAGSVMGIPAEGRGWSMKGSLLLLFTELW